MSGGDKNAGPTSPVCYAGEADSAYMGFASRDELNAFLTELLESERAIADKLRPMLSRVRDDASHSELHAMFARHEENIAKLISLLSA
ncbi:MAG: hypothetical protein ABSC92_11365 [Rhizomicrobium sp.]|jgi:hypothetical protein